MFFKSSGESRPVECGTPPAPPHGHGEPQAFAMICEPVCTCLVALLQHEIGGKFAATRCKEEFRFIAATLYITRSPVSSKKIIVHFDECLRGNRVHHVPLTSTSTLVFQAQCGDFQWMHQCLHCLATGSAALGVHDQGRKSLGCDRNTSQAQHGRTLYHNIR